MSDDARERNESGLTVSVRRERRWRHRRPGCVHARPGPAARS
jgi:hypothetical protein